MGVPQRGQQALCRPTAFAVSSGLTEMKRARAYDYKSLMQGARAVEKSPEDTHGSGRLSSRSRHTLATVFKFAVVGGVFISLTVGVILKPATLSDPKLILCLIVIAA